MSTNPYQAPRAKDSLADKPPKKYRFIIWLLVAVVIGGWGYKAYLATHSDYFHRLVVMHALQEFKTQVAERIRVSDSKEPNFILDFVVPVAKCLDCEQSEQVRLKLGGDWSGDYLTMTFLESPVALRDAQIRFLVDVGPLQISFDCQQGSAAISRYLPQGCR